MLADHQGTIRDLVDGQLGSPTEGEVVNHLTYDAYGQLLDQTASDPAFQTRYGYTGQELDAETGLMYYNARWYDPRNGRFISEDPIGLNGGDYNLSRYVANSPTNGTDPSGMFLHGIISGIAGWLGQREGQRAVAEVQTVWSNSADMATGWRVYTTAGTATGSLVGVRQVSDACALHDAVDGHEQSVLERAFDGASGTAQLIATGMLGGMSVSGPRTPGVRFGPHIEGPLPAEIAGTFRGGSYSQVALESETVLYRVYGGSSPQLGGYWSRTAPQGPLQARMDLALPPGNTAQCVVQIRVPKGTTIFEGAAGPSFGQLGGGSQVYVPRVNPKWMVQP